MQVTDDKKQALQQLLEVMQQLRDPDKGCPWDLQQTCETIIPYTLEEAYEVADAIQRKDYQDLKGELGDLLFQVVFYSQIMAEEERFDFYDVAQSMSDKLIRRHPHVFADKNFETPQELKQHWEQQKQQEKQQKTPDQQVSIMDDLPISLPALPRAEKMQKRASRVGFDWSSYHGVVDKLEEEMDELKQELAQLKSLQQSLQQDRAQSDSNADLVSNFNPELVTNKEKINDEIGDVFFTLVNLCRHLNINSETCLRQANQKFDDRFRRVEDYCRENHLHMNQMDEQELDQIWQALKNK